MIKINSNLVSALVLAQLPFFAIAADQCLSGKEGNNHLISQLAQAKSKAGSITEDLYKKYNLDQTRSSSSSTSNGEQGCGPCNQNAGAQPLNRDNLSTATELARNLDPNGHLAFKPECLSESGETEASTSELKCPQGSSGKYNLCFTAGLAKYQNAVITDFYKCVKKLTNLPLSPVGLYEMYSLESGFKPHYAYTGGVGMGQLTSIFVNDINQKNRGYTILQKVAETADPDCSIAQKIASKDTKRPVRLNDNRCKFVEYGEGLERNVLYTLVGMANSWEKDIEPIMSAYSTKHQGNPALPRAQELALLNTYGPGGRAAARAAVRRLTKLTPTNFVNQIQKPMHTSRGGNLTSYIGKMKKRQQEIARGMPANLREDFLKDGGARSCVNTN